MRSDRRPKPLAELSDLELSVELQYAGVDHILDQHSGDCAEHQDLREECDRRARVRP